MTAGAGLLVPVPPRAPTPDRTDRAAEGSVRGQKPQDQLIQPQSWRVVARRGHLADGVIQRKFLILLKPSLPNGNAKRVAILLASLLQ